MMKRDEETQDGKMHEWTESEEREEAVSVAAILCGKGCDWRCGMHVIGKCQPKNI